MKLRFLISKSVYILKVYSIHHRSRQNTNVKKFTSAKKKCSKKSPPFSFVSSTHHSFTFISRFLYELEHKVPLSKTVSGIFHFRFRFGFIKVYIFLQQKAWILLLQNVIIPFEIKIIE